MNTFEKSLKRKPARVVKVAMAIAKKARAGAKPSDIEARRMRHCRDQLAVEIGREWRVVLDEVDGRLVPRALMSHEQYSRGARVGR